MENMMMGCLRTLLMEARTQAQAKQDLDAQVLTAEEEIAQLGTERGVLAQQCESEELELALTQDHPSGMTKNQKRLTELDAKIRFRKLRVRALREKRLPLIEKMQQISEQATLVHRSICEKAFAGLIEEYEHLGRAMEAMTRKTVAIFQPEAGGVTYWRTVFDGPFWPARELDRNLHRPGTNEVLFDFVRVSVSWRENADAVALHDSMKAEHDTLMEIKRVAQAGEPGGHQ